MRSVLDANQVDERSVVGEAAFSYLKTEISEYCVTLMLSGRGMQPTFEREWWLTMS
jgi:hypothetical protein